MRTPILVRVAGRPPLLLSSRHRERERERERGEAAIAAARRVVGPTPERRGTTERLVGGRSTSAPSPSLSRFLPSIPSCSHPPSVRVPSFWALPSFNLPFERPSLRPPVRRSFPTCSAIQAMPPSLPPSFSVVPALVPTPHSLQVSNKREWQERKESPMERSVGRTDAYWYLSGGARGQARMARPRPEGRREGRRPTCRSRGRLATQARPLLLSSSSYVGPSVLLPPPLRERGYNNTVQKVCARSKASLGLHWIRSFVGDARSCSRRRRIAPDRSARPTDRPIMLSKLLTC